MIEYLKEIVLDFSGGASGQRIVAKQGDKKSRFIKITPILNGQPLVIDADCTIDLRCTKPDKTTVRAKGTLGSDGKITVELPEQALAVRGDVKSDVAIIGNQGEILSSSEFIIEVRGTPTNAGQYIPSEDYFKRESDIDMNNHQLKNLSAPQDAQDAATKKYVDAQLDGKLSDSAGSVKSNNLADGCVSWNHIGDGQVTATKIAENAVYAQHIVDGNVTEAKLSSDVAAKLNTAFDAVETIGAVQKEELFDERDGLYVTKRITTMGDGKIDVIYDDPFWFLALIEGRHIIIISRENGIFTISRSGTKSPYFNSTISETTQNSLNAPTTEAVYNAIQEALYVDIEEVIA